jgi:hypothetical protein
MPGVKSQTRLTFMTWIVGRALPWGYAAALSDIRVTFTLADRSKIEVDCLQKIYEVGPFIALGFAGSVRIGFRMVERLRQQLGGLKPGQDWKPDVVAELWPEEARKVFARFSKREQDLTCQLLMVGAHPTRNNGDATFAVPYVYRFKSPDFVPQLAGANEIVSIGSGEAVAEYSQALRKLDQRGGFEFLQLEVGQPGGSALGLLYLISQKVEATPKPGISHHMHICVARRGEILLGNNNQRRGEIRFDKNNPHNIVESSEEDFTMPPLAHSEAEFKRMLRDRGMALALATC